MAGLLDSAIGDPAWLPHPVRIMGKAISWTERLLRKIFRTPVAGKLAGTFLVMLIVLPAFFITGYIAQVCASGTAPYLLTLAGTALLVYLCATTLACRELLRAAQLVIGEVDKGDIAAARHSLSMIVGRDTASLSESEILKATMETLAENLSDGIVAPLIYLTLGGLPLAMAYKAINTLDSMVGYKNEQYRHFGWASARLDDAVNFIPARITGIIIVVVSAAVLRSFTAARWSWRIMRRDGSKHTSPNSGIPEAAMAGALGIRMGGPSTYGGMRVEKPCIGEMRADNHREAAAGALRIVQAASLLALAVSAAILYIRSAG
jgi:adenosylcobinamide-phosphate synthase